MGKRIGKKTRTSEFREKQESLAIFLFGLVYGPISSIDQLKQYGSVLISTSNRELDKTYYKNYMADADDILRSNPHLLSLDTRERMGLWAL